MYRFAPSPTGDMHIGNLRAAIFNYICSLQDKSGFILRIEDTDTERNIDGKGEEIKKILAIFGIKWDAEYIQSENLKFHRQLASQLLINKKAFACFCTPDELEAKKEAAKACGEAYRYDGTCERLSDSEVLENEKPFVIRMKKPERVMSFTDLIKGELSFEPDAIDSFVIMRADKTPTYNFACAVDDMLEGVTCVIRGEDHTSNTPKQELIREALGYNERISYAHLPIILNEDGKKMSKRDNSSSVKWLLESGFLPEAITNYLVLLGNKTPVEIFTMSEAAQWFDIKNVSRSPARFDIKKLEQINREHIRLANNKRLSEITGFTDETKLSLVRFYTQESSLLTEIIERVNLIYNNEKQFSSEHLANINQIRASIDDMLATGAPKDYDEFKKQLMGATNLKGKSFFIPLRLLLTGSEHGPELSELYPIISKDLKAIIKEKA
ncbi:glutamate--tRNA ligase [Campylobacter sp. 19-13652]|uniref:glutamate--tRNA ligase n=1 Tax=Campylobacter sp. 19-13652 TaxID=2840180 RepID=UPI001C76C306|nr:glutamate--tRNA ligase [Campylobacter sp. 19-13652]BCX79038.1 glutamate--tRNA ligase 1 [Campylobacter sp. 19-13652]